jgi:WD40 repeat protein
VFNKSLHNLVFCAAFIAPGTFLHGSQLDQKRHDSFCNMIVPTGKHVGQKDALARYVQCIDDLQFFPKVLAELIAHYAYKKTKLSHDKIIFKETFQKLTSAILFNSCYIATCGSESCKIGLWDYHGTNKGMLIQMPIISSPPSPITALAILPDLYNPLASGLRNGTIKIWDFKKRGCRRTIRGHNQPVTALAAFSSWLVSASGDSVRSWHFRTGVCLGVLGRSTRDEIPSYDINLSSEKTFNPVVSLISISNNRVDEVSSKNISKLIINNGKLAMRIHYHTETDDIRSAVLADDNILIATTKPCLKILNVLHGKHIASITLKNQPTCLAYYDGTAFVGHVNGSVTVVDVMTRTAVQKLHAHKDSSLITITSIIPLDNGSIIASCLHGCMHLFNEKS